jgi:hypothetical protein
MTRSSSGTYQDGLVIAETVGHPLDPLRCLLDYIYPYSTHPRDLDHFIILKLPHQVHKTGSLTLHLRSK